MTRKIDGITIETSTICDARCIICPNSINPREPHLMPLQEFQEILSRFEGLKTLTLCGLYEPLTDDRLEEILDLIEHFHPSANICLFTNAFRLDSFSEVILSHNVTHLTCSVHGYSKRIYEEIMVGLDRDKVYTNIINFMESKGGMGKKPKTSVSLVRIKQNIGELQAYKEFWKDKVELVSDFEIMNWRGTVPLENLVYENPQSTRACPMFEWPLVIDAYGNVVRCCYCFDRNYGHVLKGGLEKWKNKTWETDKYPEKDCISCVGWKY